MSDNVQKKISEYFLIVNKIRLTIILFLVILIISFIFKIFTIYWFMFVSLFSFIYIFIFSFYFQKYYDNFKYELNKDYIVIHRGVFYFKTVFIRLSCIKKVTFYQSFIQRIFKVKTVKISSMGFDTYILCLDEDALYEFTDYYLNYSIGDVASSIN